MISIRHSLDEIEERERRVKATRECFSATIHSMAEYAIEVEPEAAAQFRDRLSLVARELAAATFDTELQAVQSSFRGELRQYRDRCHELIARLRNKVSEAAKAVQTLTDSVSANGAGYESDLNREISRLETAGLLEDLPAIRTIIHDSSSSIQRSFELMQAQNQTVLAQLQDEIRSLHKAMEMERRALHTDAASGAWNQRKLAQRFDQLLKLDESFAVLLLAMDNWKSVIRQHPSQNVDSCLKALVKHLQFKFGTEGLVGRWSDDVLAVIIETEPIEAKAAIHEILDELSAGFPLESAERNSGPILHLKSDLVGRERRAIAAEFYPQLGQRAAALTA